MKHTPSVQDIDAVFDDDNFTDAEVDEIIAMRENGAARPSLPPRKLREVTNAELLRIATQNPPPREWLEGGEECPF